MERTSTRRAEKPISPEGRAAIELISSWPSSVLSMKSQPMLKHPMKNRARKYSPQMDSPQKACGCSIFEIVNLRSVSDSLPYPELPLNEFAAIALSGKYGPTHNYYASFQEKLDHL
jgi:hypothetical protein